MRPSRRANEGRLQQRVQHQAILQRGGEKLGTQARSRHVSLQSICIKTAVMVACTWPAP